MHCEEPRNEQKVVCYFFTMSLDHEEGRRVEKTSGIVTFMYPAGIVMQIVSPTKTSESQHKKENQKKE